MTVAIDLQQRMKLVLVSQWYPPEQAPIGYMIRELAQALIARGHEVTVITGFPNHPSGALFGGYRKQWRLKEKLDNVDVWRMYLFTSANRSKWSRILTFLSYTLSSAYALLVHRKPDLIFSVFQPLSVGVTLPPIAWLRGAKLVLNVQDLHPDAPVELGLIRNPLLIGMLRWVERFGYRASDGLAVICEQFRSHCVNHGGGGAHIAVIPNWIDLDEISPGDRMNGFRTELGLSSEHIIVLFAGTIGFVANAEVILEVAELLRDSAPNVRFVFVGEGPAVGNLKRVAAEVRLCNVLFAPFQPRERLSAIQAMSDISVVTMGSGKGRASVPSKVLGYMAAARPVIAAVDVDSETAALVIGADCGKVTPPGNAHELAQAIVLLADDEAGRRRLGNNGRKHLEQKFGKDLVVGQYIDFFESVARRH